MGQDNVEKEPIEEEIIAKLMDLRSYLQARVQQLEEETEKLRALFKIVDEVILTKSFKKAEVISVPTQKISPVPKVPKFIEEIPLKTASGMLLATIYVSEGQARVVPEKELAFNTNTSPYQQFMITRILEPMRIKDVEASRQGLVMPNQVLSYETVTEGEAIKELIIKNYGDKKRLREIVSSARWTFDKMYEKTLASGEVQ